MDKFTRRSYNKKKKLDKRESYQPNPRRVIGTFFAPEHKHVTSSKLESKVMELFKSYSVEFIHQYKLGRYYYDFLIGDSMLIEVHGSYYHSSPLHTRKYARFKGWKKQRARDKKKARLAVQKGYKYRVLWEHDIDKRDYRYIERVIREAKKSSST